MKKAVQFALATGIIISSIFQTNSMVLASSSNLISQSVAQKELTPNEQVIKNTTLNEIVFLSSAEKHQLLQDTLSQFQLINRSTRGRYFKTSKTFSKAQVVKISNRGYSAQGLAALLPGPMKPAVSLIYGGYYGYFHTAASKKWKVKITLTIDSYNPTSTGMSWSVSYVKK